MTLPRSTSSFSRRLPAAGAFLLAVAGLTGWADPAEVQAQTDALAATNAAAEFDSTYRYSGGKAGRAAIEQAVDEAIADMNPLIRGMARSRLLDVNAVIRELEFSLDGDPLRSTFKGRLVQSPASGAAVPWVNHFGDTIKVSQRWNGRKLVQRMFDDSGSRTNVYRFSEDGQGMTMSVTIEAKRLPKPIRYRLRYRKKES